MRYLSVTRWEEFQGYRKGTRPEWIRTYPALLNPAKHPKFAKLSDGAKLTLHHLRLLAGECDNMIPQTWISRERLNMQRRPQIDELEEAGFVSWNLSSGEMTNLSSNDKDHLTLVSSTSPLFDQAKAFDELWVDLIAVRVPKPRHKSLARRYFFASVQSDEGLSSLRLAIANYRSSKRVACGFVQDASTFLNDWQTWAVVTETDDKQKPSVYSEPKPQRGVCADDIRDIDFRIKNGLWTRTDCTVAEARAYLAYVMATHSENLENAPTLDEYVAAMRGESAQVTA